MYEKCARDLDGDAKNPFAKLSKVYALAKKKTVSYTLHWAEADDSFYFSIESIAPAENFTGKAGSLDSAVKNVVEWLETL